ncbi:hypothetical protein B0T10DRAFT_493344 [Thelonectria olida]|uniref:P-loop containing nucleoside triphosphate hydrolase protein n=1 Tax=Thelonectria olida TaxID=1576542 RepID=A0A9P8VXT6_9HYPO|nr:hypothetical protein B0T10DRAFT_493344 [Thelonectria olida]
METPKPKREMKVLALGLVRTGSASICKALTILGYQDVYHGIKAIDSKEDWAIMDRAADASFPVLPTYTGQPFTRGQWDELFGHCEATTDVAAVFAPQLIEAYPEAKVLLVIRDFDKWFASVDKGILSNLWSPVAEFSINYVEPVLGSITGISARKQMLGFFEAHSYEECHANARKAYDRHHRVIREMVPPERLLEYRMGEGWEPLCEFLDKAVPDVEFPWVNEAAELQRTIMKKVFRNIRGAIKVVTPWVGGAIIVGAGSWFLVKQNGYT